MPVNAVAPWEGELEWVGEPNSGQSPATGQEWKSVDFTVKYQDHQMNERHMTFSAFGVERVNKLLSIPYGTKLKIVWWPDCNQSKNSDRWFPKNSVLQISVIKPEQAQAPAQQPQQRITAAQTMYERLGMTPTPAGGYAYPQQGTQTPGAYQPQQPQQPTYPPIAPPPTMEPPIPAKDGADDLPF